MEENAEVSYAARLRVPRINLGILLEQVAWPRGGSDQRVDTIDRFSQSTGQFGMARGRLDWYYRTIEVDDTRRTLARKKRRARRRAKSRRPSLSARRGGGGIAGVCFLTCFPRGKPSAH